MATLRWRQLLANLDVGFLTTTIVLVMFGLAALYSFSINATNASTAQIFTKQLTFVLIGLALAAIVSRIDYRWLGGVHWLLYATALFLLIAVRLFGQTVRGTTGWFEIAGFQFQPVEVVKLIMCVVLARYFSDHRNHLREWRTIVMSGLLTAAPVGLVLLQPDFGSSVIIIGTWLALLMLLPVPRRSVATIFAGLAIVAVFSWFVLLRPYQQQRILNFLSPGRDRLGSGYNVQQAITAVGSGQFFGRGLGLGPQSQLNFLPERQTDFIFASIGEELGFIGAMVVVALFGLFFWRVYRLARSTRDNYSLLLVMALLLMLIIQVTINIAMNVGLFPVTGVPLPFLSYGGSSMLASFLAIGLLESLVIRQGTRPMR